MFLYKTKFGMEVIDYVGKRFSKALHAIKYLIIAVGYLLMGIMVFLLAQVVYIYIKFPQITDTIKAPPVMPLIPYFPQIFGVESLFPPFYFTYFILALIIVAFVHEFAHGIYMKLFNIRIKSTGVAFLGPILGAFVEQDEKQMNSKPAFQQMVILGAGVFANILFALIFFILLVGFFSLSFVPAGYVFNSYAVSEIPIQDISGFGNMENLSVILNGQDLGNLSLTKIMVNEKNYFMVSELRDKIESGVLGAESYALVFEDAPAINAGLRGVIKQIDDVKIADQESLRVFLENKNPGDKVLIKSLVENEEKDYELILQEHPFRKGVAYLGVASLDSEGNSLFRKIILKFISFKEPSTYYEPKYDGGVVYFIYNLFWWIAIINLFVALFNMLPLGILDGGRFFYLTVIGITKSEKIAKKAFRFVTWLILLLFIVMIVSWVVALV